MTTRILVIDADLSAARQVCRLLEAAGHQARVCTSESQAVEVLTSSALQRLAVGAVEGRWTRLCRWDRLGPQRHSRPASARCRSATAPARPAG